MTPSTTVSIVLAIIGTILLSHSLVSVVHHRAFIASLVLGLVLISLPSFIADLTPVGKWVFPFLLLLIGLGPTLLWWAFWLRKWGQHQRALVCAVCGALLTVAVVIFGSEALQLIMNKAESYPAVAHPE